MSLDATIWAWRQSVSPTQKLVLLSFADRAGESHSCFPSVSRLVKDTGLDRKTIYAAIAELEAAGLVIVLRKQGETNEYQLIGVTDRHDHVPKLAPVPKTALPSTKNGTTTSPKNGTQNLPIESTINLPSSFDEFWQSYPRKQNKQDAQKAFKSAGVQKILPMVLDALERFKQTQWKGKETQYIPYAGSWIRGRRWEDELPSATNNSQSPQAKFAREGVQSDGSYIDANGKQWTNRDCWWFSTEQVAERQKKSAS